MSQKNKLQNKGERRNERAANPQWLLERTPVSQIAQKTSARLLSNPKVKITGRVRRHLQASRGLALDRPLCLTVTHLPEVKVTLRLQALPMVKLIRRLKQAARRASTCKFILADIDPKSKFVAGLKAEQTHQLSICRQVAAEIAVRNHQTQR